MSTYPLRLYRAPGPDSIVVNNGDEEDAATENGYKYDPPAVEEFPKALYLHPIDKTHEHKSIVVQTKREMDQALSEGYKVEPHVPVAPPDEQFEENAYEGRPEAQGSGSERWGASDWTQAGQRADGSPCEKGSPEDVSEPFTSEDAERE